MKLKPLGKNVLVHPIEDPSTTRSGLLYLPEQSKQRIDNGIVIAKGPLVSDNIQIADHVSFSGYSGEQIVHEEAGRFFLIPESHINAILLDEDSVLLLDSLTAIRLIKERMAELRQEDSGLSLDQIESSLVDRIEMLTTSEGFMF